MWNMIWPVLIVVTANTVYNICAKSTPQMVNGFASLFVSYVVAAIASLFMFWMTSAQKNLIIELQKINWTAFALGVSIVALEFGFLCVYRAGWKISMASLVASITLACVLLVVGVAVYKETFALRQVIGVCVCVLGFILLVK